MQHRLGQDHRAVGHVPDSAPPLPKCLVCSAVVPEDRAVAKSKYCAIRCTRHANALAKRGKTPDGTKVWRSFSGTSKTRNQDAIDRQLRGERTKDDRW